MEYNEEEINEMFIDIVNANFIDKPQFDFRDDSQVHQCWDCDSEGEFWISEEDHTIQ